MVHGVLNISPKSLKESANKCIFSLSPRELHFVAVHAVYDEGIGTSVKRAPPSRSVRDHNNVQISDCRRCCHVHPL